MSMVNMVCLIIMCKAYVGSHCWTRVPLMSPNKHTMCTISVMNQLVHAFDRVLCNATRWCCNANTEDLLGVGQLYRTCYL